MDRRWIALVAAAVIAVVIAARCRTDRREVGGAHSTAPPSASPRTARRTPSLPTGGADTPRSDFKACSSIHPRRWCDDHRDLSDRCDRGEAEPCFELGNAIWKSGDAAALDYFLKACHRDITAACDASAKMKRWYDYGFRRKLDDTTRDELAQDCDHDPVACMFIAMNDHANPTAFETACNGGVSDACLAASNLATTALDRIHYLQISCEAFDQPSACFALAELYADCGGRCGEQGAYATLFREVQTRLPQLDYLPTPDQMNQASARAFGDPCDAPCPTPDAALAAMYQQRGCDLAGGC